MLSTINLASYQTAHSRTCWTNSQVPNLLTNISALERRRSSIMEKDEKDDTTNINDGKFEHSKVSRNDCNFQRKVIALQSVKQFDVIILKIWIQNKWLSTQEVTNGLLLLFYHINAHLVTTISHKRTTTTESCKLQSISIWLQSHYTQFILHLQRQMQSRITASPPIYSFVT